MWVIAKKADPNCLRRSLNEIRGFWTEDEAEAARREIWDADAWFVRPLVSDDYKRRHVRQFVRAAQ